MTQAKETISRHREIEAIWEVAIEVKHLAHFLMGEIESDAERRASPAPAPHTQDTLDARSWAMSEIVDKARHVDNELVKLMNKVLDEEPPEWTRQKLADSVRAGEGANA